MAYAGPIKNIVVLMFENRSYDNILGMLYNETLNQGPYRNAPPGQRNLAGLTGNESNPDPLEGGVGVPVWGTNSDPTTLPGVDPGESFYDMSQQFLGLPIPPVSKNHYPSNPPLSSPWDGWGLTNGYIANFEMRNLYGNPAKNVMHFYLPGRIHITGYLANSFMVCDQWYASAPTQTFANRLFSLCANPGAGPHGSFINDVDYAAAVAEGGLSLPSVFDLLDRANPGQGRVPNWKVYFHDVSYTAMLLKTVRKMLLSPSNANLGNFDNTDYPPGYINPLTYPTGTFFEDVKANSLAPFTLIEPRYTNNYPGMAPGLSPNSNHPGLSSIDPLTPPSATNPPIDVMSGESLLREVFLALRTSPTYWKQTLFIVTYDEHGGLYDHLPPPPGTRPGIPNARNGFEFNWLGGRVPTIIISPYVTPGSQLVASKGTYDHTSIISTAREVFNLGGPINARDENAPVISLPLNATPSNNPDPTVLAEITIP
jgi:phospholipase C